MTAPRGLHYVPDAIPPAVAAAALARIAKIPASQREKVYGGREVAQFGARYVYERRALSHHKVPPIPRALRAILRSAGVKTAPFTQCIVNWYQPGEGISAHTDASCFGPDIVCASLSPDDGASAVPIVFCKKGSSDEGYTQQVEPNAIYFMTGPSRYDYTHAMPARKTDTVRGTKVRRTVRVSATFRSER